MIIDLALERKDTRTPLRFAYKQMVNAGYTGRNQAEVRKHIEELARKGIPGPPTTPTLYPVIRRALVKDPEIEVYSRETCGEAEYVLLIENERRIYVGLGSDHTDRKSMDFSDAPAQFHAACMYEYNDRLEGMVRCQTRCNRTAVNQRAVVVLSTRNLTAPVARVQEGSSCRGLILIITRASTSRASSMSFAVTS